MFPQPATDFGGALRKGGEAGAFLLFLWFVSWPLYQAGAVVSLGKPRYPLKRRGDPFSRRENEKEKVRTHTLRRRVMAAGRSGELASLRCRSLSQLLWFCFCHAALRGELQPQLLVLELLQENHDGLLVHAGLPPAGHQQDAHHLLLHAPHQLRRAHGTRGRQGRQSLLLLVAVSRWATNYIYMSDFFFLYKKVREK